MRNAKGHGAGGGGAFPTVGEMYFDLPTLKNLMSQVGKVTKDGQKKLKE